MPAPLALLRWLMQGKLKTTEDVLKKLDRMDASPAAGGKKAAFSLFK